MNFGFLTPLKRIQAQQLSLDFVFFSLWVDCVTLWLIKNRPRRFEKPPGSQKLPINMRNTLLLLTILVLAIGTYFLFFFGREGSSLQKEEIDFAVADTSQIDRIVLTQMVNGEPKETRVLDRQASGKWTVDGEYTVLQPRLNALLRTMHLIHVKEVLVDQGLETARKLLGYVHTQVEIFGNDGLIKAYQLGTETKDSKGTVMMMEGSNTPYIIELPGLQGFVNATYSLDPLHWRENLLFRANLDRIQSISLESNNEANPSFVLKRNSKDEDWTSGDNSQKPNKSDLTVYLSHFQGSIYAETFASERYPDMFAQLQPKEPTYRFSVNYFDGTSRNIILHIREDSGNNYFGWVEGEDELLTIQTYVFDKFLAF